MRRKLSLQHPAKKKSCLSHENATTMASFITTMFVHSPLAFFSPRATSLPPACTPLHPDSPSISSPRSVGPENSPTILGFGQSMTTESSSSCNISSNARSRPFKPRSANKGTSSYQLRQFAEATLGSGSLRKAVKLPEGEDLNEWLAVNREYGPAGLGGIAPY
jgi:MOB kinase activator 1